MAEPPRRSITTITGTYAGKHGRIVIRGLHSKPESTLRYAHQRDFKGSVKIERLTCNAGKGLIAGRWEGTEPPLNPGTITQDEQNDFAQNGCEIMHALWDE